MSLYESIKEKKDKISVIGLGYVGLPLAVSFAKVAEVIGFDISEDKVNKYLEGIDVTKEVGDKALKETTALFTSDSKQLRKAKFHIVAVPTPINKDKSPDLSLVKNASKILGRNLVKDSIVVYESTVFPGVTEEICVPILENESGLRCGLDFRIGYSPERINPGDKIHRLENIVKVVSAIDVVSLDTIAKVYELVVQAGIYKAESIKVAEAAKVIENSQRDINIAFMNELSIIFNKLDIDTKAVLEAANTKWNFLNFTPGLVGGHCIGVDPYYLTYKAEQIGYHSQIILSGRKINDGMGKYVSENLIKNMIKADKPIKGSTVAIFGITFKENCPDIRNTRIIDIVRELEEYGINIKVIDPIADMNELWNSYKIKLFKFEEIETIDASIFAVPHEEFKNMKLIDIKGLYNQVQNGNCDTAQENAATSMKSPQNVLIDIKGIFDRREAEKMDFLYWRL